MNDKLLDKWLNGALSDSEMESLKDDPKFMEYLKIDGFIKRIDMPSKDVSNSLQELKESLHSKKKSKLISLQTWIKVAAAAVVILAVGYFYNASLTAQFETQFTQTELLQLPDDSQVILNENSQLSFHKNNWNKGRSLSLDGEAYFEVTKGATFEVQSEHGKVTVLGTKFNVLDREGQFEVVCFEGSVGVRHLDSYLELGPGDMAILKNNKLIAGTKYTMQPNWIANESSFDNKSLLVVLAELKSVYDVNIITENIDVDLQYTGSFTNLDLETALETITLPLGLDYAIEDKNVTLFENN